MADQNRFDEVAPTSSPPNLLEPEAPQQDFSKNTILVLLVLTIFVSAFGTWIVLNATNNVSYQQPAAMEQQSAPPSGELRVKIADRDTVAAAYAPKEPVKDSATGLVVIKINS